MGKKAKSKGKSFAPAGNVSNSTAVETPPGAPFPKEPTIFQAIEVGVDPKLLLRLIQQGEDVNAANVFSRGTPRPLHFAAELGSREHLKVLLENGAKPDIRDCEVNQGEGRTPLYFAFANFIPIQSVTTSHYHFSNDREPKSVESIIETVRRGDYMECIRELVRCGANPNSVDHNGMPPADLPGATKYSQSTRQRFAEHLRQNPENTTLMHMYAEHLCVDLSAPETEVMDLLSELGTNFDQQTTFIKQGFFQNSWYTATPLQMATRCGHVELVKELIKRGCKVTQHHLRLAGYWGNIECARILIANGADPNGASVNCNSGKHKPEKEIHFACFYKRIPEDYADQPEFKIGAWKGKKKGPSKDVIKKLYDQRQAEYLQVLLDDPRVDIKAKHPRHRATPVHLTISYPDFGLNSSSAQASKLEKLILKDRTILEMKADTGETPLNSAVVMQLMEHIKILLKHGANPNTRNSIGVPPIFRVFLGAKSVHLKSIITLLVKHGAEVNCSIGDGQFLVHFLTTTQQDVMDLVSGCYDCSDNCVKIDDKTRRECLLHLKKLGMDVDKDHLRARGTALQIACMEGASKMVEILIEAGADVNKSDRLGQGPLHYAASSGHAGVLKILLNNNANIGAKTIRNETAEDLAERGLNADCLKMLQQARKRENRFK